MTQHRLKTWTIFFNQVVQGSKTFEIRLNDRNFKIGDTLLLMEYDPLKKAVKNRTFAVKVTYILSLKCFLDIKGWRWQIARVIVPDLVVMAIQPISSQTDTL
ncbi:DUF3850 domain-containing protein (plasmid) [Kovacikia minuta CCNUW1]|uniref:DUF3850 domain-containing protein n=1 Tax=Kovacikia minuta TaxID=2931930 RepID=UPI001CCBD8E6|nr:DUF3850 domain-containing protein [Kovacikia minuta]UBF29910.1 DUF3850 domain-containing protein [Kovacikia minuta CCNUW1]